MRVLVYTAKRWRVSTWRMFRIVRKLFDDIEVTVLTCPGLTHETFPYEQLAEADLVYFRLHGLDGQSYLYGQGVHGGWQTGFSLELFKESGVEFKPGCKVFLEGCFNALTGIPEAFISAGAGEVIAASTTTWNGTLKPGPAAKLGLTAIRAWLDGEGRSAIGDVRVANVREVEKKHRMSFARYS